VLESVPAIGLATSSRNAGVIRAGIYCPPGSWNARLCVRGKALLYDLCASRDVPFARCGKLIVATTDSEVAMLRAFEQNAALNHAGDLHWRTPREVASLEPEVRCVAALESPSTGIVDVHQLMLALRADIESGGGQVVLNTPMVGAEVINGGFRGTIAAPRETCVTCRGLVNAAGLEASSVAGLIRGLDPRTIPGARFARGQYHSRRARRHFGASSIQYRRVGASASMRRWTSQVE